MFKRFARCVTLAKRFVRIYILKPAAVSRFFDASSLPMCVKRVSRTKTALEPKQVAFHPASRRLLVSCMKGQVLQAFTLQSSGELSLEREWKFPLQCVEVSISGDLCFVTMTNFKRLGKEDSRLVIINLATNEIVSTVATGGEWSKVAKKHPTRDLVFISNWHSHNVSVIDISCLQRPKLISLVKCGESPRGVVFTPEGLCLATGFYSGRIYTLGPTKGGQWGLVNKSPKVTRGYLGNLRDILLHPKCGQAYVSNLGRNEVCVFDQKANTFVTSILVGRQPNALSFLDRDGETLLISCRADNIVLLVNTKSLKVVGRSSITGALPTGLATVTGGFFITCFKDNTIEYYK